MPGPRHAARARVVASAVALTLACGACRSDSPPVAQHVEFDSALGGSQAVETTGSDGPSTEQVPSSRSGALVVDAAATTLPIAADLFGTNVPAWVGADVLESGWFEAALVDAGVTSIRMPGGSWSNTYAWDACEEGRPECWSAGSATPSDFAGLLERTGLAGTWTVSINASAQSAAALVAFFNGRADDATVIGVDRFGDDWGTVGRWASLRASRGYVEPVPITRWEIGNEVYGGRPALGGPECASFGWEEVWTCDGRAYMEGDAGHDGFLAIRSAMLAVDPTIAVGAVGVPIPSDWSGWGDEVLAHSDAFDFYVLHVYGFDTSPDPDQAVSRAAALWPDVLAGATADLAPSRLAVTEYNLVSFEAGDTEHSMTTASNALFLADSLGRLASAGVGAANHWNMVNGTTGSGTDYGLVEIDSQARFPAFSAFEAWSLAGSDLLLGTRPEVSAEVTAYPTLGDDGALSIIVLNSGQATAVPIEISGVPESSTARVVSFTAAGLTSRTMERAPDRELGVVELLTEVELPAFSINVVQIANDDD